MSIYIYYISVSLYFHPGASLVKGIPMNPNDTEVSGPDIFQRLVPMEAHQASSMYRYIFQSYLNYRTA